MNDDSGHIVSPPLKIEHQREYKVLILDRIQDSPTPNMVKVAEDLQEFSIHRLSSQQPACHG